MIICLIFIFYLFLFFCQDLTQSLHPALFQLLFLFFPISMPLPILLLFRLSHPYSNHLLPNFCLTIPRCLMNGRIILMRIFQQVLLGCYAHLLLLKPLSQHLISLHPHFSQFLVHCRWIRLILLTLAWFLGIFMSFGEHRLN